jgi:ribosome biogenesis GTPase
VGAVSRKIERGRHTTRQATLFPLPFGGFALDTPGFSVFEIDDIAAGDLARYFPEMAPHTGACRFAGCAHLREPDCAVRAALENGEIAPSRYENYAALYETVKAKRRW